MKFSVLISVYKNENHIYFDRAIKSIWTDQTLKPNQVVLVKDGPLTTELEKKIEKWKTIISQNFTVVELPKNLGLAEALNIGIKYCNNEVIARMDSDDVSLPNRFEKQIKFLKENNDASIIGSGIEEWDENLSQKNFTKILPSSHSEIIKFSRSRSPLNHPTVVFKKNAILECGGYPKLLPEDYLLWCIAIKKGLIIKNQPDILLKMRCGQSMLKRRGLNFLKGEIKLFVHIYKIGHIDLLRLLTNVLTRIILRLCPISLKMFFYKKFRK